MAARTLSLFTLLLAIALVMTGCKKDDFANETVGELNKLADEIVAKVKEGDDRKASIDAAQKMLDDKRGELAPKMKQIMELRGFEVSEETAANVNKVRQEAGLKVAGLAIGLNMAELADQEVQDKLTKLVEDFAKLVDGE